VCVCACVCVLCVCVCVQWIREGEGFLLVYDITNQETLEQVRSIYQQILRVKDTKNVAVYVHTHTHIERESDRVRVRGIFCLLTCNSVLVGNKCDLDKDRKVTIAEGKALGMCVCVCAKRESESESESEREREILSQVIVNL